MYRYLALILTVITLSACSDDDMGGSGPGGSLSDGPGGSGSDAYNVSFTDEKIGVTPLGTIRMESGELLTIGDRVFFGFNSATLSPEARQTLKGQAQWLIENKDVNVTIEGHCDERGTREYNLALGERRANAAKNYLVTLGVSPTRISVISYGKEHPEYLGSNEAAWSKNRRAVVVVN